LCLDLFFFDHDNILLRAYYGAQAAAFAESIIAIVRVLFFAKDAPFRTDAIAHLAVDTVLLQEFRL